MAKPDDLEAVRTIASALSGFSPEEQERILRWVREKIGLAPAARALPDVRIPQLPLLGTPLGQPELPAAAENEPHHKDLYEVVAGTNGSKIRPSSEATEGDEMKVARSIKSPQGIAFRLFHTNHQVKTRTLKTEGCGTHVTSVINKDK
jgi:hypothetical protein